MNALCGAVSLELQNCLFLQGLWLLNLFLFFFFAQGVYKTHHMCYVHAYSLSPHKAMKKKKTCRA